MNSRLYILFSLIVVAIGCTHFEDTSLDNTANPFLSENEAISISEAIKVANDFASNHFIQTKGVDRIIEHVTPINNSQGEPRLYVINFEKASGFIIVSASRNYTPVLAYNENGCFNPSDSLIGIDIWIDEQIERIDQLSSFPADSTELYRMEWERYLNVNSQKPKTKTVNSFILEQIAIWEAQGYNCYFLSEQPNYMPNDVYQNFCSTAQSLANPDYDYLETSIILESRDDINTSTGNLVTTHWGQTNHYNDSIKVNSTDDPSLGCTVVAVGQIMRYHEYPSNYNWNNMANNYATPSTASLLKDIYYAINWPVFNNVSDPYSAKNWFVGKGYTQASVQSHDLSTVRSNLVAGHPVLMSGSRLMLGGGHSWVCSGYSAYGTNVEYTLRVISIIPPLQYENAGVEYRNGAVNSYYYMNWGWEGYCDGWFINDSVNANSEKNYQYNRTDIINIYP